MKFCFLVLLSYSRIAFSVPLSITLPFSKLMLYFTFGSIMLYRDFAVC